MPSRHISSSSRSSRRPCRPLASAAAGAGAIDPSSTNGGNPSYFNVAPAEPPPSARPPLARDAGLGEGGQESNGRHGRKRALYARELSPGPDFRSNAEIAIEKAIWDTRFLSLFAIIGSLLGAALCFFKGCLYIAEAFSEYSKCFLGSVGTGQVILSLVEAVDVYLVGTVMLIFGMGLYELFIAELQQGDMDMPGTSSSLFGLFRMKGRPRFLQIRSLDDLKTKVGHVIIMILLVGMFEKSKKVVITTCFDLLCFAGSILLASSGLFLLNKLSENH